MRHDDRPPHDPQKCAVCTRRAELAELKRLILEHRLELVAIVEAREARRALRRHPEWRRLHGTTPKTRASEPE